jgi:nitrous oxidase accessory protein NosD
MERKALLAVAGLLVIAAAPALAETEHCTSISSVPATITASGVYCLTGHLTTAITSGAAITINANDVRLDLNGWRLQGPGGATWAEGIRSSAANVSVENGTVRGFYYGVDLRGPAARVEGLSLNRNTMFGVMVAGSGALVRGNRVTDTGGSMVAANRAAIGIAVRGPATLVDDNLVSGLRGMGTGAEIGIYIVYADQVIARDNVVVDDVRPSTAGASTGVWIENSDSVSVVADSVTNFEHGVSYHNASGTYSRNVVVGCDVPYYGGSAGSGND